MKTVVPTTLDIAREAGWSGENEPKDFVGALKLLSEHIGSASPEAVTEAVDDWLDGHPEALVADGSVTTEKLADGAVTEEKLGVDLGNAPERVAELLGNQLTGTLSGTIDTAADAYAAPPMALTVKGASTQAGTPTPDAPVPILSVDDLALEVHGKNVSKPFSDPDNPDFSCRSSGGGTVPMQYDASIGAYYTTGHRIATFGILPAGTYTVRFKARRRTEGTANTYTQWVNFSFTKGIVNGASLSSTAWTDCTSTVTTTGEDWFGIVLYNNIYVKDVQLELGSTATAYEPYQGQSVPLYDGTLYSLPDGTKDTLNLSYLRPSTRAGWAWYSREVTRRVGEYYVDGVTGTVNYWGAYEKNVRVFLIRNNMHDRPTGNKNALMCDKFQVVDFSNLNAQSEVCLLASYSGSYGPFFQIPDTSLTSSALANAWFAEHPTTVRYAYDDSHITTETLDPIELPTLPASTATVWCDGGSATPTFVMKYVQDTNIVIAELRAALADLATS